MTSTGTPKAGGAGDLRPRPGAAPLRRMLVAQAALETRLLLRNGEQVLLTIVIPSLLLVLFGTVDIVNIVDVGDVGDAGDAGDTAGTGAARRVDFLTPGVLALAVLATSFTGQAIATGFERRYGVLKRLGATPLPRWALLTAKTCSVLVVQALQTALLVAIALALGWSPRGGPTAVPVVLVLLLTGTAAFSGLGLLMAGTLRAEATLAAANLVFVLLLVGGGVVVPLDRFPGAVQQVLELLPITALSGGLRAVLTGGTAVPWGALAVLAAWAVAALTAAARFFRWE